MPEIQTLLREYGDHLEELAPAISVDELDQVRATPQMPTPWWQRPAMVVASASVVVLLVIGGLSWLFGGAQEEPADSSTPSSSTVASTVPPTSVAESPPTTTPSLQLTPPPPVGDPVEWHPDLQALASLWIGLSLNRGDTEIRLEPEESENGALGMEGIWAFPSESLAVSYMTTRMAVESDQDLVLLESLDVGEQTLSYPTSQFVGQVDVHLVRVGRFVYEIQHNNEDLNREEINFVVSAMETDWNLSITAFRGVVEELGPVNPSEAAISYEFLAWSLPVPDGAGGDIAEYSFGYDRDGSGTCRFWTGGVEPYDYVTYTTAGATIDGYREYFSDGEWLRDDFVVPPTDASYLSAVAGCDRFPPHADGWGLGDLIPAPNPIFDDTFTVYQTAEDEFVLVAAHNGFSDSVQVDIGQLSLFDLPPGVTVIEPDIEVDFPGYVQIEFQLEGPRDSLETMLGIDLSVMPNARIGAGFSLATGPHDEIVPFLGGE